MCKKGNHNNIFYSILLILVQNRWPCALVTEMAQPWNLSKTGSEWLQWTMYIITVYKFSFSHIFKVIFYLFTLFNLRFSKKSVIASIQCNLIQKLILSPCCGYVHVYRKCQLCCLKALTIIHFR